MKSPSSTQTRTCAIFSPLINRFNISHAFYWALGKDELNPLAGRPVNINAQMFALELSYDRDWIRFRSSYFFASGDDDVFDGEGKGFDTIFDNPNFSRYIGAIGAIALVFNAIVNPEGIAGGLAYKKPKKRAKEVAA